MSSSPLSSKTNTFSSNQVQYFTRQNSNSPLPMNFNMYPSNTARTYGPRPFYRSRGTPEPFDYTNQHRHENNSNSQRRYSVNQINGSSLSNSYFSDHEPTSPKQFTYPNYRSVTPTSTSSNPNQRLFSVNTPQSPLVTFASRGSPNRSEIHFSPSSPNPTKIRISRPDSPSIIINNRQSPYPNGNDNGFHISVGRSSPSIHQIDNRFRFQPLPSAVNLPPTRLGHLLKKDLSTDIDYYTKSLLKNFHSNNQTNLLTRCARCHDEIIGEENRLDAMDQMYHVSCFTCTMCGCRLRGMHFYSMENQPYCETCYITSLEKCVACAQSITDRILRATGKPYHPECFCCVFCRKSLDGVPFTIDARMDVYCIDCFHQKFAPRCHVCHRAILPTHGQEETIRIVALDRNYHVDCYRCENCSIQFTLEQGCYPVDDHLFCVQCNRKYSRQVLGHT